MKLLFVITVLFMSCHSVAKKDSARDFIPGSYVRTIDHEFAKGSDTLVVELLNGNNYQIVKRSGFIRIRHGKELPFEQNSETWAGVYDEKEEVIYEQRKGKRISFVPSANQLRVGSSVYQKINP